MMQVDVGVDVDTAFDLNTAMSILRQVVTRITDDAYITYTITETVFSEGSNLNTQQLLGNGYIYTNGSTEIKINEKAG